MNEVVHNVAGGTTSPADYADQATPGATFDLARLMELSNAAFQLTYAIRTGHNLVDDAQLGTLQLVQEVWGRGQTARLTEFSYDQTFFNSLLDWKVGRFSMGADFAAFACDFQNLTLCGSSPGNIVGNYIHNWPISQWGTRLEVKLDSFGYARGVIFDENPQYLGCTNALWPWASPTRRR